MHFHICGISGPMSIVDEMNNEPAAKKTKKESFPEPGSSKDDSNSVPESFQEVTVKEELMPEEESSSLRKPNNGHEIDDNYVQIVASKKEVSF